MGGKNYFQSFRTRTKRVCFKVIEINRELRFCRTSQRQHKSGKQSSLRIIRHFLYCLNANTKSALLPLPVIHVMTAVIEHY